MQNSKSVLGHMISFYNIMLDMYYMEQQAIVRRYIGMIQWKRNS